ncbi:GNAT family N-acetyltransferase [Metabacillus sediminilitoris]|uniref:GNAT family N-acetyltransferase n=1 Tax=Metabacillus sediminilitoris TaxID=2567941 RepID=A0A4S4BR83_9BACI|nr:GNAT family protein [Metabacillus sediminilitoris]QGQ46508.1 GNAT family N-acetyltransferase [Metabacillus sediminilitoris]THF77495.1 GNAT family N-acetyltransferase [Metabacillus sediminilitoris]
MIKLSYFTRSDFKQLINWIDSPEFLLQWGGPAFEYPLTESQLTTYLANANHDEADKYVYKVLHKETGKVIGHISLGNVDRKHKSARVGKVLVGNKDVRGQGIGQQMLKEVLKIAFGELNLHRVSLGVFDFNVSAINCYEKVGFKKEGVLRDSRRIGNTYWSSLEMSMLENEWAEWRSLHT